MVKGQKKKLTGLERKFVKSLCSGMTLAEAAIEAGYSPKNAAQSGFQALKYIEAKMPELMDRQGLTASALINKYLLPALEAEETEFAKFEGKISDKCNVIAWGPRLTALDMALKLRGSYAPVKTEEKNPTPVSIQVSVVHVGT
jgi:phage terminase small subunit